MSNLTAMQVMEKNYIDEAVARASKELADEIDFQVLAGMYKEMGWTQIKFNPQVEAILAYEIQTWMKSNLKGHYISRGDKFLFERDRDAMLFTLKWVN